MANSPIDARGFPEKNRNFRYEFPMTDNTGAVISASWVNPTCAVIIDDAAPISKTPVQYPGTAWGYVDLDATEVANSTSIKYTATINNANALTHLGKIYVHDNEPGVTGSSFNLSTLTIGKMITQIHRALFNRRSDNGAALTIYGDDSVTEFAKSTISLDVEISKSN